METSLKYDVDNLLISQDKCNKNLTSKTESMMSLSNGYLGLKSIDEEIEKFNKEDLFVNGIFNKAQHSIKNLFYQIENEKRYGINFLLKLKVRKS